MLSHIFTRMSAVPEHGLQRLSEWPFLFSDEKVNQIAVALTHPVTIPSVLSK